MEAIVFDNDVVRQSILFDSCADTLLNISNRDYPNRYNFDSRIKCLDIDSYERNVCGQNPDNTVDAVIGICNCKNDKRKTMHRLMLLELRMDYESNRNLSITQMNKKVAHTRNLLGGDILIDPNNYFLFDDAVSEQIKRWFANKRVEGGSFKNCVAWSVNDFKTNVISYDDLPYTPQYDKEKIIKELSSFADNGNWDKLFSGFKFWLNKAKNIQYVNNREYENLSDALYEAWKHFNSKDTQLLNDDDMLEKLILEEDIETIIRHS